MEQAAPGSQAVRPRIAVIDDDLRLAELVKLVLEELDESYDVQFDPRLLSAYDFIKQVRPDLIILDMMMGVDPVGFETLDKLSGSAEMSQIPVVISSAGLFVAEQYERFISPISLLPKPFHLSQLVATVRSALSAKAGTSHSPRLNP